MRLLHAIARWLPESLWRRWLAWRIRREPTPRHRPIDRLPTFNQPTFNVSQIFFTSDNDTVGIDVYCRPPT